MALPGITVTRRDTSPPAASPTDTSVWFVTGITEKGQQAPIQISSMADYATLLGGRVSYGILYDALDVFFREGGSSAYVSRVVGPNPVAASHTFQSATPDNSLVISANSVGAWGNGLSVAIVAGVGGGTYQVQVSQGGVIVEQSGDLTTQQDAVDWSQTSDYLSIALGNGTHPPAIVAATPLTLGDDDHVDATETQWEAALARFTKDLGPGQVSAPGRTTGQAGIDLLAHAAANNRVALLDLADSASKATLVTAAAALASNGEFGGCFTPWAVVPGVVAGTTRTVPYSAVEAGIMARNDTGGESPNQAAAGEHGISQYALGLSQAAFTDSDRSALNDAGVNVARIINGQVRTYGYRSLVNPAAKPNYVQLSVGRLLMAITAQALAIGERYIFGQIDGRGNLFAEYGGDLDAMLARFYNEGSLYGATPADAYSIDVGPNVNTTSTIQAGQINSSLQLRVSPFGETVNLFVTNRAVTDTVS
jgi:hypothetical protein